MKQKSRKCLFISDLRLFFCDSDAIRFLKYHKGQYELIVLIINRYIKYHVAYHFISLCNIAVMLCNISIFAQPIIDEI